MSFFNQLGRAASPQTTERISPAQMMQQLQQNPAAVLQQAGLNIPAGMNDPRQMVNHLLQSGQVTQNRYQQALQMMGRMGRK